MDRKMELAHLAITEKALAEGERHFEREEQMIADLERGGLSEDTKLAYDTLAILRRLQTERVAHRDPLLKMLRQGGCDDPIFRKQTHGQR